MPPYGKSAQDETRQQNHGGASTTALLCDVVLRAAYNHLHVWHGL